MALLEIKNLATHFRTLRGTARAVDGVSLELNQGEVLGLIGESGCGKSTLGMSLMRLHSASIANVTGSVVLDGTDLLALTEEQMAQYRWKRVAMVPQSAMNALNPVLTVGEQIAEPVRIHMGRSRAEALEEARRLLALVGIAPERAHQYPHEFSGGMRQRVCIAMALACKPQVLICDEATTGLDVMTQAQVIGLLRSLRDQMGISIIFISHDLPLVLDICDRVAIMYAGKLAEVRSAAELQAGGGLHPYTEGLMQAFPPLFGPRARAESIPGVVPSLLSPPAGCRFAPRCKHAEARCMGAVPHLVATRDGGHVACFCVDPTLLEEVPAVG